jgi:polar amino acid transport system substrate-binding protein
MKRFSLSTIGVACVALLFATTGSAQPAKHTAQPARHTGPSAAAAKLPALPANIKARGRWNIGVKCDVPPFGYTDVRGNNAGFDVEVARQFARYAFGRATSVNFLCAPTASREPLLTNDRADLVISTFTYTADREARIDFSRAYYKATGRLLVKNDGAVQKLADIAGKKVATTSGSVYDRWMKNCFKNTEVVVADTFTNAMLAFNQGRADAVMYDDAVLLPVAAADRNAKLTDEAFLEAPFGIGIKQGNKALKAWVDSRLNLMRTKDLFYPILKANIAPRFLSSFSKNVLRPSNTFSYAAPGAPSVETVCS